MADWSIETPNLTAVEQALIKLATLMSDLRPFWPVVSRLFVSWMGRQFDSEGAFLTDPWEELSPDYAAWKSQNYPGKPILSLVGPLRKAATSPRRIPTPLTLTLVIEPYEHQALTPGGVSGILDPEWFQEGTSRMPARPLIFEEILPAVPMAELTAAMEVYARSMVVASGLSGL